MLVVIFRLITRGEVSENLGGICVFLIQNYSTKEIEKFVNIGTGIDNKINDLANIIQKSVECAKGIILWDTSKPDGIPRRFLDVSRLKKRGWEPRISLEEGVRMTYEWYISSLAA